MRILDGAVHLTYCSNIHPGESWAETRDNVLTHAPTVKAALSPDAPFGIGLRLSARAADELMAAPGGLDAFADALDERGLYVFTLNGFPHGDFHAQPVKESVYQPDWSTAERLRYTEVLATILARLLPAGVRGSISTVPGGFRPLVGPRSEGYDPSAPPDALVEHLLRTAAMLWRHAEERGVDIALALEPEPECMLETTAEAIAFFEARLWSAEATRRMVALTGLSPSKAEEALRYHLGLCLDTCHAAVEYEDPARSVAALRAAGVRVAKLQATTGLHIEPVDASALEHLKAFAEDVYLHQVVARLDETSEQGASLRRFLDLPQAMAAHAAGECPAQSWRVHYHVPVFQSEIPPFRNTDGVLEALLHEVLGAGLCDHVEVETYTWSVLPPTLRDVPLTDAITRELRWVLDHCRVPLTSKDRTP
ncbi:MAG: metabolite traffic protein EboE [Myxococcota bacterium]